MTGSLAWRVVREKGVVLAILCLGLLGNIGVAAIVVYPTSLSVRTGERQAEIAARTLREAEREFTAATAATAGKTRAADDLARFYGKVLPRDLAGARRATYLTLTQLARAAELTAQRRTEEVHEPRPAEGSRETTLVRLGISMVLEGDYASVRQFLRSIEAAPEFIVIDNVALSEGTQPGSPLVLTMELSTYYRRADDGH